MSYFLLQNKTWTSRITWKKHHHLIFIQNFLKISIIFSASKYRIDVVRICVLAINNLNISPKHENMKLHVVIIIYLIFLISDFC